MYGREIVKEVVWMGDSKAAISEFSFPVKEDLGFQLYQLQ